MDALYVEEQKYGEGPEKLKQGLGHENGKDMFFIFWC